MSKDIVFNVTVRERIGSGGAREARRSGLVPGVLYGGGEDPVPVALKENEVVKAINTGQFLSSTATMVHDGKKQLVIPQAIQLHPVSDKPQHVDLFRVKRDQIITVEVTVNFIGEDDAPHGHMHFRVTDVRVPADHLLLGEGRGFEISQGRLGPGRIHHCMRAIGQAEHALALMCKRSVQREAFGKPLAQLGANFDIIANCRMEIEQARLLCLKAAWMMDQGDPRAAAPWISQIKVVAPLMALKVTDEAVQMFGAAGISQDTPLARQWMHLRTLRLADGPDAVHRRQVARNELKQYTQQKMA